MVPGGGGGGTTHRPSPSRLSELRLLLLSLLPPLSLLLPLSRSLLFRFLLLSLLLSLLSDL